MCTHIAWVVGCVLLWPSVTSAEHIRPILTVRVYDGVGISAGRMREAERTVRAVLAAAGLDLTWRECPRISKSHPEMTDSCVHRIQSDEIVMRILGTAGANAHVPSSLGFSYVDPGTRRGWLATAFADRIIALAGRLHINAGRLLGRTMVHEIGHLILATTEHTAGGLMRRQWSDLTILLGDADRFLPDQAVGLQLAVSARNQFAPLGPDELGRLAVVLVP